MTSSRDAFLQRVREAVAAGNRPGSAAPVPARGRTGYQGGSDDPVTCFCVQCRASGGHAHTVADSAAASSKITELLAPKAVQRAIVGEGEFLDSLAQTLEARQIRVDRVGRMEVGAAREAAFQADVGISGVEALVAETGSIVVRTRATEPRGLTLLPPVHIAVATRGQLFPDLFDYFDKLAADGSGTKPMPSCVALITGPSKTGDIELQLVTGVHGPGEVHVVLIDG